MRVKPLLLVIVCALALAGCAKITTTTTNQPAGTATEQTSTTTTTTAPPAALPQAPGAPPTAVAANSAPAGTQLSAPAASTATTPADPCRLLTSDDIKAVQGDEVKGTKTSQRSDTSFAIGQCFYTTATFTKSISLEVTDQSPGSKTSPREFWKENFTRAAAGESEREREQEREREREHGKDKAKDKDKDKDKRRGAEGEEAEGAPPQHVAGIGDEAYWVNSRVSGALYVLKGNRFIRISLGGTDDDAARQRKAKTLAQKALARL